MQITPLRACLVCLLKNLRYNLNRTLRTIILMHNYRIFYSFCVYSTDVYYHLGYLKLNYIYLYSYPLYEL